MKLTVELDCGCVVAAVTQVEPDSNARETLRELAEVLAEQVSEGECVFPRFDSVIDEAEDELRFQAALLSASVDTPGARGMARLGELLETDSGMALHEAWLVLSDQEKRDAIVALQRLKTINASQFPPELS